MVVAVHTSEFRIVAGHDAMVLDLDSLQGLWTAEQYLRITNATNWLIEFTDGKIEVLPLPTDRHQAMLRFLFRLLDALMQQTGGTVFFAALRLQIRPEKFREPDLLLLLDAEDPRRQDAYWWGADLVLEVVSPDNPERDTVEKRGDYAEAGIPEYWIVNPLDDTITVLRLADGQYVAHGVFRRGETATSALLADFAVAVTDVLDAH
jgi:Uma2 family endonuclease